MEHFFSGLDSPGHWACRDENFVKNGQFSGESDTNFRGCDDCSIRFLHQVVREHKGKHLPEFGPGGTGP